jgi:hypothetical protein
MTVRSRIVRLYDLGLLLFPKEFRSAYKEQLLLTAEDMLNDADAKSNNFMLVARLFYDLFCNAIKEHFNQLKRASLMQKAVTRRNRYLSAALLGLQVFSVLIIAAFCISNVQFVAREFIFNKATYLSPGFAYATLAISVLPVVMIALAFLLLRRSARFSLWSSVVRACLIGVGGMVVYTLVNRLAVQVFWQFAPFWHPEYTDWLFAIAALISLYYLLKSPRVTAAHKS